MHIIRRSTIIAGIISASLICPSTQAEVKVLTGQESPTMVFAREEIEHLTRPLADASELTFELSTQPEIPAFQFRVDRKGAVLSIAGHSPAETLAGVYTVLGEMGFRFEVTGPVAPQTLDPALVRSQGIVAPDILRRGVRQHINFNMDVSAWPLQEAKEYIRNLARMRFNYMTFHSYPAHWTRDRLSNAVGGGTFTSSLKQSGAKPEDLVTGAYFYGTEFKIPDHPLVRPHIRFNKKSFTAPEFEDIITKHPERGQRAQTWLRELMGEAKRCGMIIQFSTEPKVLDDAYNEQLADRIVEDYPMIDYLEFISAESGDFKDPKEAEVNEQMAVDIIEGKDQAALAAKYFGPQGVVAPLGRQIRDYANCIRIVRHLQAGDWEKKRRVGLICGSYAVRPYTVSLEMNLAERFLRADQILAIMPGHSSRYVASAVKDANIRPETLKRILFHSWLEFDGYMMLQQQAAQGLYDLANYVTEKTGAAPYGIVGNHWRTARNALSFRYLDLLAFNRKLTPVMFFEQEARAFGIADARIPDFVSAMNRLDELSDSQAIAGNIGFNMGWGINPEAGSIGNVWWWTPESLAKGLKGFQEVRASLEASRKATTAPLGIETLDLLLNGVDASIQHLKAVIAIKPIADKYYDTKARRMRSDLAPEDEAFIAERANEANTHFQNYLKLLSEAIVDRSEEGMLVTYYWGPVVYGNNIRAAYGKQGKFIRQGEDENIVPQPLTVKDEKAISNPQ
jgi:hypothetical protein